MPNPALSEGTDAPASPALHPVDEQLPALANDLRLVCQRIARRVRFEGSPNLAPHQVAVLMKIMDEARTPTWLAEAERVSTPSMTRTVNCLEEGGSVRRVPHPTDGRQVLVELTDLGRSQIAAVMASRDGWMISRIAPLTPADHDLLRRAVVLLQKVADQ